jgi:23S rRNA maturation-related 3'-5' exoribonuclease YhaM
MKNYFDQLIECVDTIKDQKIHDFTLQIIYMVDHANWKNKASQNHHPPDERGEYGNSIHSIRVLKITCLILDLTEKTELEKDIIKSSAILHDCTRFGVYGEFSYTVKSHPQLAVDFIKNSGVDIPSPDILENILYHMSQWSSDFKYYPKLDGKDIIILADYIASNENILINI